MPDPERKEDPGSSPAALKACVEFYAGHKGDETPRAVVVDGRRLEVVEILRRTRALDRADGRVRDVWRCRLEDGRAAAVERLDDGTCRVSVLT